MHQWWVSIVQTVGAVGANMSTNWLFQFTQWKNIGWNISKCLFIVIPKYWMSKLV